jgi:hypothetical protein
MMDGRIYDTRDLKMGSRISSLIHSGRECCSDARVIKECGEGLVLILSDE